MGVWDNTYDITLYPGIISGYLPSNIFDIINVTIAANQYVTLSAASDGYGLTSVTWGVGTSLTAPPDATADTPPSSFDYLLGILVYNSMTNSVSVQQIVTTNLLAQPSEWTRSTRAGAGPFDLPYVIYYEWQITNV